MNGDGMRDPRFEHDLRLTRRQWFSRGAAGIGVAALATLLRQDGLAVGPASAEPSALLGLPHWAPRAKRVVVLWQGGAPSQVDLFDPKPGLAPRRLQELPASVRKGTRLSTMTSGQANFPILPAIKPFTRYGNCGMELSTLF